LAEATPSATVIPVLEIVDVEALGLPEIKVVEAVAELEGEVTFKVLVSALVDLNVHVETPPPSEALQEPKLLPEPVALNDGVAPTTGVPVWVSVIVMVAVAVLLAITFDVDEIVATIGDEVATGPESDVWTWQETRINKVR
jgi:hypothetical protein